jgi:hypothetical protein
MATSPELEAVLMTADHISTAFSVKVMHAVFALRRGRWGSDGKERERKGAA